jgi:hypothetical protein
VSSVVKHKFEHCVTRLVDDARQFLLRLVPAAYPYLHNDLHLRKGDSSVVMFELLF